MIYLVLVGSYTAVQLYSCLYRYSCTVLLLVHTLAAMLCKTTCHTVVLWPLRPMKSGQLSYTIVYRYLARYRYSAPS
jgi:hypothetical protein